MEENKSIYYNTNLLKNYLNRKYIFILEDDRQKLFDLLTLSYTEDTYCFLRILLYIANTRNTDYQENFYKVCIHFLGIMFPETIKHNLDLFIKLGRKQDILYFMQCNTLTQSILKWVKHISKSDNDFNKLNQGEIINVKSNIKIRYKRKSNDNISLLSKILDDPNFNGLII